VGITLRQGRKVKLLIGHELILIPRILGGKTDYIGEVRLCLASLADK